MNTKAKFAYVYMIGGLVVFLISILVLINDKLSDLKTSDSENAPTFLKTVNLTSLLIEEIKLKFIDTNAHYNEIDEDVYYGHGGEMAGGGGHHQPAHPAASGEKDVIKLLLQQLGGNGPITGDHLHHLGGEGLGQAAG